MAYGRLDVFWPDGKIESFMLDADKVAVGRSTGNTIILDTDVISRYHFSITRDEGQSYMTDLESVNGTFVDGVRLTPNERSPVNGGEEIQIGYLRMLYFAIDDDAPTVPMAATTEDTERIEGTSPEFRLELQPPPIAIAPGAYMSAELTIFNTGRTLQSYTIQSEGLPQGWCRVNRPLIEIEPNDSANVVLNIKPIRRSDSVPGVYTVKVLVRLQDRTDIYLELPFKVTILAYAGLGVALATKRIGADDPFVLYLHNQGSAPLALQISGRDTGQNVRFIIRPNQITLAPGQRTQISGEVKPLNRRLFGSTQEYPFELVVNAVEMPYYTIALRGYFIDKPPLPFWASFGMGGALLLAVALVLFGVFTLVNRPADPTAIPVTPTPTVMPLAINTFTVNPPTVIRYVSQPITISYDVLNAAAVTIDGLNDVAQTPIPQPDANASSLMVTIIPTGDLALTLIAVDSAGNPIQQTLTVPSTDATCTTNSDQVKLYDLPSTGAKVVNTAVNLTTLVTIGRDPAATWLQVILPGNAQIVWGERVHFICAPTFRPEDLQPIVVSIPATPTITPTIAPPLTVIPQNAVNTPTLPPPPLATAAP